MNRTTATTVLLLLALLPARGTAETDSKSPNKIELQTPIPMTATQQNRHTESLEIGDSFQIKLSLRHSNQYEVSAERFSQKHLAELQRLEKRTSAASEKKQRTILTYHYQVFAPGTRTIPSLAIRLEKEDEQQTFQTKPVEFKVKSTASDGKSLSLQQHVAPQKVTRFSYTRLWVLGAAGLVGLSLLWFLGLRGREEEDKSPAIPPYEEAIDRLDEIRSQNYIEREQFDIFFLRTSHVVRKFFEREYGFPAAEMTTAEIYQRLQRIETPASFSRRELRDWLLESDYYKFSEATPDKDTAKAHLDRAITLVGRGRKRDDEDSANDEETENA